MNDHSHGHGHKHGHDHGHSHDHLQSMDPILLSTSRGIRAVTISFIGLMITAIFQLWIVWYSGSVALLADTIHNFGDAGTAVPSGIAFWLARKKPTKTFTYGFGRAEDFAGLAVVAIIFFSAAVAGYEAVNRLIHPQPIEHLGWLSIAAIVGFLGNEWVAIYRIRAGKAIGSAALVADGHHARIDGLTSLAVLGGAMEPYLGFPLADPIVGLGISIAILRIVWNSAKAVITRVLDGVEPDVVHEIEHAALHVEGVRAVRNIRARWLGHRLLANMKVVLDPQLTVTQIQTMTLEIRHQLAHHIKHLADANITVEPADSATPENGRIIEHSHGNYPTHVHVFS